MRSYILPNEEPLVGLSSGGIYYVEVLDGNTLKKMSLDFIHQDLLLL